MTVVAVRKGRRLDLSAWRRARDVRFLLAVLLLYAG